VNSERPTRQTVAGRAYLDLQNLARRQSRPTDELQQLYALEGFLARVAASAYAERFVLKGGVLLAAYGARRPTRDVDMQGREMSNRIEDVLEVVREGRDHSRRGRVQRRSSHTHRNSGGRTIKPARRHQCR